MDKKTCIKELSSMIRVAGEALLKEPNEVFQHKVDVLKYALKKVKESGG